MKRLHKRLRNPLAESPPEFFEEPERSPDEKSAALARVVVENAESERHRPATRKKSQSEASYEQGLSEKHSIALDSLSGKGGGRHGQ